jgi:hypothetical protein
VRLDPGEAERIAALVAEAVRREPPARFLDAAATARMLSVERDWVYEHAEELGGVRLGGPRGRLRFDRRAVCDRLAPKRDRAMAGGPQARYTARQGGSFRKGAPRRTQAAPMNSRRRKQGHDEATDGPGA